MDRQLRLAIGLALIGHWPFVAAARYRLSYDAYVHIFFADHYRRDWWALWEPRWYAGFTVVSYPPLVHQLIAALSPLAGIEIAWAIVLLSVLIALPTGVYAFARIFVGRPAASYAAIASAVMPSTYLSAHAFGQLPTLAGLLVALWGLAALAHYLQGGRSLECALAVALMAVVAAAHHGTLLFLPWGVAAVAAHRTLHSRVVMWRWLMRLAIFSLASIAAVLVVIWPFWQWGVSQTMQTPIDHLSRHNLILDPSAAAMFFWPVYGPLVFLIPWVVRAASRKRRIALGALFAVMLVLGLGGTTPLPRWLYGEQWAWLTYDRFALWASIALLPFAGLAILLVQRRLRRLDNRVRLMVRVIAFVAIGASSVAAVMVTTLRPTQPRPVDMRPIVTFLAQDDHSQWRYLTFGFGDQMARLSLLTDATTIDGSYHTARQLPELRASGIGQIDAAYWSPSGVDGLDPILDQASTRGVRWGFVNLNAYSPVLIRHGWRYLATLPDGVEMWDNPSAAPAQDDPPTVGGPLASISWGTLPLVALVVAGALALLATRKRNG